MPQAGTQRSERLPPGRGNAVATTAARGANGETDPLDVSGGRVMAQSLSARSTSRWRLALLTPVAALAWTVAGLPATAALAAPPAASSHDGGNGNGNGNGNGGSGNGNGNGNAKHDPNAGASGAGASGGSAGASGGSSAG